MWTNIKYGYTYKRYQYPENLLVDLFQDELMINDGTISSIINIVTNKLPESLREIVYYRYDNKLTLQKIADNKNITKERVRQLINNALHKIRTDYYASLKKAELNIDQTNNDEAIIKRITFIHEIGLLVRISNLLKRNGIDTIDELLSIEKSKLFEIYNLGSRSVNEIILSLKKYGFNIDKFI